MIPISPPQWQGSTWKKSYADAIQDPQTLLRILKLPSDLLPAARIAARQFPLRVPKEFIARMRPADPADPLLLQVLPLHAESFSSYGYSKDPVGDGTATVTPGLLHKYHGRVLLLTTGACAVHCRYCFRRHFPYSENSAVEAHWPAIENYLRADTSITEVILSGGDPLSLDDERLKHLLDRLQTIDHIQRVRIHTRLPVMIPSRVTPRLLHTFKQARVHIVMVVHINHANEIDNAVVDVCRQLQQSGVVVLNQSVLLRGINDSTQTLERLSEALFHAGIMPYYLHTLDKVDAAAHFEVAEHRAAKLVDRLSARLPGYLVPKLVRDVSQAPAKQLLTIDNTLSQRR